MFSAFLAAFINAFKVVTTKEVFKFERVNHKSILGIGGAFALLVMLVPFYLWGEIDFDNLTGIYIILLFLMIVAAFIYNQLYTLSLEKDDVCKIEPIIMLEPLSTIILASIIFPSERNIYVIGLAAVATAALFLSRVEKHHLKMDKYMFIMFGYVLLMGVEAIFAKVLLEFFSPIALYTIRVAFLSALFLIFLKPNYKVFRNKEIISVLVISLMVVGEYLAKFYAISSIGVAKTSLIFLLGPVMILLASKFFLKEKITVKHAIGDTVIVLCIASALIMGL